MQDTETNSRQQANTQTETGWAVQVLGLRRVEPSRGAVLAHVDIELSGAGASLKVYGLAILEGEAASLWVGWPQRKGEKKYFPVVTASKRLHDLVQRVVLAKFEADRDGF